MEWLEIGFPHIHCWNHDPLVTTVHAVSALLVAGSYMYISFCWLKTFAKTALTKNVSDLAQAMSSVFVSCGLHYLTFFVMIFKSYHYLAAFFLALAAINGVRVAYKVHRSLEPISHKYAELCRLFVKAEQERVLEHEQRRSSQVSNAAK